MQIITNCLSEKGTECSHVLAYIDLFTQVMVMTTACWGLKIKVISQGKGLGLARLVTRSLILKEQQFL